MFKTTSRAGIRLKLYGPCWFFVPLTPNPDLSMPNLQNFVALLASNNSSFSFLSISSLLTTALLTFIKASYNPNPFNSACRCVSSASYSRQSSVHLSVRPTLFTLLLHLATDPPWSLPPNSNIFSAATHVIHCLVPPFPTNTGSRSSSSFRRVEVGEGMSATYLRIGEYGHRTDFWTMRWAQTSSVTLGKMSTRRAQALVLVLFNVLIFHNDSWIFDEIGWDITCVCVCLQRVGLGCFPEGPCPEKGANTAILGAVPVVFSRAFFFGVQVSPTARGVNLPGPLKTLKQN